MNKKPSCQKCQSVDVVKNGKIQGKQRDKCKFCSLQFTRLTPRGRAAQEKATLLRRDIGKSFSEILLELRMGRAVSLLNGTNLSIENIALRIGYRNSSNFYKTFRGYYGKSPRYYQTRHKTSPWNC